MYVILDYIEALEVVEGYLEQGKQALKARIYDVGENDMDEDILIPYVREALDGHDELERAQENLRWFFTVGAERLSELFVVEYEGVSKKTERGRTLYTTITQGMINQSLLTLTDAVKRKLVNIGDEFSIVLPDGTSFDTELTNPGNRLAERGRIRFFYKNWEIKPGDTVTLVEEKNGSWLLKKTNLAEDMLEDF